MSDRAAARDSIGVAVIGAGAIGTLRARLAAGHSGVSFLAVCDIDEAKQKRLAEVVGAELVGTDAAEVIADPRVDCVIVATSEENHGAPLRAAIEAGKPALVEKPFTVDEQEARKLVELADARGVAVAVGYTQRFRRRYLSAKEQIANGFLGDLTTISTKIYVTRAVGEAVMARAPTTTPAINTGTYCGDLLLWYLDDRKPLSVYAQSSRSHFYEQHRVADATSAVIRFEGDVVANFAVSWEPPREHPAYVASMQMEVFGRAGMLGINDDHRDQLLVSAEPIPSPYTPHVTMQTALLGSAMPGDWAVGGFHGPMKTENDAFLDGVIAGALPDVLPDAAHGLAVLQLMRAIDESAASGGVVELGNRLPA